MLDPEQNSTFSDHYLEIPYDLSDVLFIATANTLATIPAPLLDRMELIEISGYTKHEKFAIARDHLLPATLEEHGLDAGKVRIEDDALNLIIEKYTREAGVRWLKKQLAKIARFVSEKIVSGNAELPYLIKQDMLNEILGKEIIRKEEARKETLPGVVTGLAWTPVGRRHPLYRRNIHARKRKSHAYRAARGRDERVGNNLDEPDQVKACACREQLRLYHE